MWRSSIEYLSLFLSAILSATLLPGSSEIMLIVMLSEGVGEIEILLAVVTLGNVLGSVVNWLCGRYLIGFMGRRWFPVSEKAYHKSAQWFERYGKWSLLLAWLPVIGDPLTMAAGALKIKLWEFIVFVTVGKFSRYAFIAYLVTD